MNRAAVARPIPREPPVTIAILPSSCGAHGRHGRIEKTAGTRIPIDIAIVVGAGPLATALASTLAARGRVRHIRLIDDAGTVAAGKALDIRQSTPVLGSDVSIDATADVAAALDADAIVDRRRPRRPRRGVGGRAGPGARRPPRRRQPARADRLRGRPAGVAGRARRHRSAPAVDADPRLGVDRVRRRRPGRRRRSGGHRAARGGARPGRPAAVAARRRLERVVDRRRPGRDAARARRASPPPAAG